MVLGELQLFPLLFAFYLLLALIGGILRYYSRWLSEQTGQEVYRIIANKLFRRYQYQSFAFFDDFDTGDLMSRASQDLRRLAFTVTFMFRGGLASILTFTYILGIFIFIDFRLSIIIFIFIIPQVITSYTFGKIMLPHFRARREEYSKMNSVAEENLTGIKVTQAFGQEELQKKKYHDSSRKYLDVGLRVAKDRTMFMTLYRLIIGVETTFVLLIGGIALINGVPNITEGSLIAALLYVGMLVRPVRMLGWSVLLYTRSQACMDRIFGILDSPNIEREKQDAKDLKLTESPTIIFDNVDFKYDGMDSDNLVLKDINVTFEKGKSYAILGSTGSGKTTIINLLPRFYEPTNGRILFNGIDIREVTLESLRDTIGMVAQETFLFTDTIADNIAFGKPDATQEEIEEAAKIAGAHDFINSLSEQYETEVGERGETLSGGQRQRVSIARTLLSDPKVVIFDDSLSAVDIETELAIQEALGPLIKSRTTLIVTQRLSSLRMADEIIVIDKGTIVEKGTHEDLMVKEGLYYILYQTQVEGIMGGLLERMDVEKEELSTSKGLSALLNTKSKSKESGR